MSEKWKDNEKTARVRSSRSATEKPGFRAVSTYCVIYLLPVWFDFSVLGHWGMGKEIEGLVP